MTKLSYDFQAALGEYGQVRESYRRLKSIHFFTRFFGEKLAPMETVLPEGASAIDPNDMDTLRFAVRTDGKSGFLFVNNYQDHRETRAKEHEKVSITLEGETVDLDISIAAEENAILPFNLDLDGILLKQANAQPVLRTVIGGKPTYVFMVPEGMDGSFKFEESAQISGDGAKIMTVKNAGSEIDIILVSRAMADNMYLLKSGGLVFTDAALLEDENGALRLETTKASNLIKTYPADLLAGSRTVVRQGDDGIFGTYLFEAKEIKAEAAAERCSTAGTTSGVLRYGIRVPGECANLPGCTLNREIGASEQPSCIKDILLRIRYSGDVAELFAGDEMISDNFWNGDIWEIGLKEHAGKLKDMLTLRISPMGKDALITIESADGEEKDNTCALVSIEVQPVYDIRF